MDSPIRQVAKSGHTIRDNQPIKHRAKDRPHPATTILCVDDETTILELYGTLRESKGYKVLRAPDGTTGIALTRTHRIDTVVLDFNMPGMDGNEVAQVLRKEQPNLPVVIWTGCPDETPESLKWFADALLYKGDGPLLLLAIEKILKDSATRNKRSRQMNHKAPVPTTGRLGAS
jgi:DNA-binding response OmpR family regulator